MALAIIGAEHILRWLPKGTHSYDMLVTQEEITSNLKRNGMQIKDRLGVSYHPLEDSWKKSKDMSVNYMMLAEKVKG
ncbi:hypothetical protein [Maritalea myrionectae]|uniref:hypothetical protein n=1 Tax=Maritalea myrionectae TaxID=454601 RepID=UPI00042549D3|nr:hypothetical protein [Maritalea myrionectae]